MNHRTVTELGSPGTLKFFWGVSIVGSILLSAWLASSAAEFVPEFLDWTMAFFRTIGPILVAMSVAGPIAAALQRSGWRHLSVLVLIFLMIGVCFGSIMLEGKIAASQSVETKKYLIFGHLAQFRRGQ